MSLLITLSSKDTEKYIKKRLRYLGENNRWNKHEMLPNHSTEIIKKGLDHTNKILMKKEVQRIEFLMI